ncbi:MAG: creatininase family protein [Anaerolineae bacterium]|nr:creatininase family protein [Anaerolineae bacterium]
MLLQELKHPEIKTYLERKKTIILPFGSMEQHGPHLPTGTDTFVAARLAEEVGKRTGTVVAPVIPVGFSPGVHTLFPGTITLGAHTYISLVHDILSSIVASGFRDMLVLTGHGMNWSPLKTALMEFLNTHDGRALVLGYWETEEVTALMETGDGVHCTILETSMMLYLRPELVEMNKAFDEYRQARFMLGKSDIGQVSHSGIIAETTKSTREKGEAIFEAAVTGLVKKVELFEAGVLFE